MIGVVGLVGEPTGSSSSRSRHHRAKAAGVHRSREQRRQVAASPRIWSHGPSTVLPTRPRDVLRLVVEVEHDSCVSAESGGDRSPRNFGPSPRRPLDRCWESAFCSGVPPADLTVVVVIVLAYKVMMTSMCATVRSGTSDSMLPRYCATLMAWGSPSIPNPAGFSFNVMRTAFTCQDSRAETVELFAGAGKGCVYLKRQFLDPLRLTPMSRTGLPVLLMNLLPDTVNRGAAGEECEFPPGLAPFAGDPFMTVYTPNDAPATTTTKTAARTTRRARRLCILHHVAQ